MEYNKDEAFRAKEIAENKFAARDLGGAKKFALKAQQLYPSIEGLSQMMAVLDVHIAAGNKVNGQMDWYAILQVDLAAEEAIIKKQYKRLALMLHPDKNKSMGAEEAFKLIGEAWGMLSDKVNRSAYDQKRNPMGDSSQPKKRQRRGRKPRPPSATAQNGNIGTFWTGCPFCKTTYQYSRNYVDQYIVCLRCRQAFQACEGSGIPMCGAAGQQENYTVPSDDVRGNGAKTQWNDSQGKQNEMPKRNEGQGKENEFPIRNEGQGKDNELPKRNEGQRKENELPKKNQSKKLREGKFDKSAFDRLFAGVSRASEKPYGTAKEHVN